MECGWNSSRFGKILIAMQVRGLRFTVNWFVWRVPWVYIGFEVLYSSGKHRQNPNPIARFSVETKAYSYMYEHIAIHRLSLRIQLTCFLLLFGNCWACGFETTVPRDWWYIHNVCLQWYETLLEYTLYTCKVLGDLYVHLVSPQINKEGTRHSIALHYPNITNFKKTNSIEFKNVNTHVMSNHIPRGNGNLR